TAHNQRQHSQFLVEYEKTYVAELTLGIATASQDAAGKTIELNTDFEITPQQFAEAAAAFQGSIEQVPPMASAVRHGGKKLYELDRKGIEAARKARQVQIYSLNIQRIWNEERENLAFGSRVLLKIVCSKGTYIRTLCHDIGRALGVGAHMSFLSRTASGPFSSREAFTLEEIAALAGQGDLRFLLPLEAGLPGWTQVKVNPLVEPRIKHGNYILAADLLDVPSPLTVGDDVILMSIDGQVLALAEIKKHEQLICQPFRVFMEG
ncbi:MAG TPA: hypothetical protein GX528_07750, partial [Firmicutes bacterium]|nr:hypothetical protein [Bacillota bacterium]